MSVSTRSAVAALAIFASSAGSAPASPAIVHEPDALRCASTSLRGTVLGQDLTSAAVGSLDALCASLGGPANGLLPAPLATGVLQAQTVADPALRRASATARVADVRVAAPGELLDRVLQTIDALAPVEVPVPALGQAAGLPQALRLDLRDAARHAAGTTILPPLLAADVLSSDSTATCSGSGAQLAGSSRIAGLSVLGTGLTVGGPSTRDLTFAAGRALDPSTFDPRLVRVLGLGTDRSAPGIDALLETVVAGVLRTLPAIELPAGVARVEIVPDEVVRDGDRMVRRALRVSVDVLGRRVAELVAAESAVGGRCGAWRIAPPPLPPCTDQRLVLTDVVDRGDHVRLIGSAAPSFVGRRVAIRFHRHGRVIAHALVGADGRFATRAPLPPRALRYTNRARYIATGRESSGKLRRSLFLKLHRRMVVDSMQREGRRVTITGRVLGPLAGRRQDQVIQVQQRKGCTDEYRTLAPIRPRPDGTFRKVVVLPPRRQAVVLRLATEVRKTRSNPKLFPTFTLPQGLDLDQRS